MASETTPPATVSSSSEAGLSSKLKDALGATAGLAAASYVFGFVSTNSFLGAHGVILYSALGSEYLAAGLSFGLFFLVTGILFVVLPRTPLPSVMWDKMALARERAIEKLNQFQAANPRELTIGVRAVLTVPVHAVVFGLGFGLRYLIVELARYWLLFLAAIAVISYVSRADFRPFSSAYLYLWVILVTVAVSLLVDFTRQAVNRKWVMLPMILIALWLSAFCYGRGLYPYLPASVGGAAPVRVKFVIDPSSKDMLQSALNLKLDTSTTPEMLLLLETADSFIVMIKRDQGNQIVQLKKDLTKGVIYQGAP